MAQTSISCDIETRQALAADKPDGETWNEYLRQLHAGATIVDEETRVVDADALLEDMGAEVERRVEQALPEVR